MTDSRIARIERGIESRRGTAWYPHARAALADLRAWQEIAERHDKWPEPSPLNYCRKCAVPLPCCPDRKAADAALDRLDALWGVNGRE